MPIQTRASISDSVFSAPAPASQIWFSSPSSSYARQDRISLFTKMPAAATSGCSFLHSSPLSSFRLNRLLRFRSSILFANSASRAANPRFRRSDFDRTFVRTISTRLLNHAIDEITKIKSKTVLSATGKWVPQFIFYLLLYFLLILLELIVKLQSNIPGQRIDRREVRRPTSSERNAPRVQERCGEIIAGCCAETWREEKLDRLWSGSWRRMSFNILINILK